MGDLTLPNGYKRVEYLESDGNQYIITDITPNQNLSFSCKFLVTSNASPGCGNVFGTRRGSNASEYQLSLWAGGIVSIGIRKTVGNMTVGEINTAIFDGNTTATVNDKKTTIETSSAMPPYPIIIFAVNERNNVIQCQAGRIYELSFGFGNVAKFIPSVRVSDSKPGLYDLVSDTFYINSGSGEFSYGGFVNETTRTASGSIVNFNTTCPVPIESFKVYFSPKQTGEGDPSPENVRPIEGWTGVTGYRCGKNLLWTDSSYWEQGQIQTGGIRTANTNRIRTKVKFRIKPNTTYTLSHSSYIYPAFHLWTEDLQYISDSGWKSATTFTFTTPSNSAWIEFTCRQSQNDTIDYSQIGNVHLVQFEFGSVATDYEPFIESTTLTIPFPQTIYGGYVDLIKGELVQEWLCINLSSNDIHAVGTASTGVKYARTIYFSDKIAKQGANFIADRYKRYTGVIEDLVARELNEHGYIYDNRFTDLETAKILLDGVQIAYKLSTPITYQLTPIELSTLAHSNVFWSNADSVEIIYGLERRDAKEIRRKVVLTSPHLATTAGGLAHFATDMEVPLDSLKVSFEPYQEGDGDPSPENVREIVGKNSIELHTTGKNLVRLPTEYYRFYPVSGKFGVTGTAYSTFIFPVPKGTIYYKSPDFGTSKYCGFCDDVPALDVPCNSVTMSNRSQYTFDNSDGHKYMYITVPRSWEDDPNAVQDSGIIISANQYETENDYIYTTQIPVTFPPLGKNIGNWLAPDAFYPAGNLNGSNNYSGKVNARQNTVYTYSAYIDNTNGTRDSLLRVWTKQADDTTWVRTTTIKSDIVLIGEAKRVSVTFTTRSDEYFIYCGLNTNSGAIISEPMLELGSTETEYEPYTNTFYGGYVDITNGKLVAEWKCVDMGSFNWTYDWNTFVCVPSDIKIHEGRGTATKVISEIYSTGTVAVAAAIGDTDKQIRGRDNYKHVCVADSSYSDIASFKEAVTGYKMAYLLETPIVYDLTPQQIKSFCGINNIFADTDSATSVTYWKHADDAIKRLAGKVYSTSDNVYLLTDDGYIIGEEEDYVIY